MKNKILSIIEEKPKHYATIIKRSPELLEWVMSNAVTKTDHLPSMIWSAVYGESLLCSSGNVKKLNRWGAGLAGCGPANKCSCTKKAISEQVSKSKNNTPKQDTTKSNQKRMKTMKEKYGVSFNSQRPEIKKIWTKPKISGDALSKLSDKTWLYSEYVDKHRTTVDIARELNVYYSTVAQYCIDHGFTIRRRSNYSLTEVDIKTFIESLGFVCESGNWDILKNKELDLYIPEKKIGIEVNGLYWHSFNPQNSITENPKRHLEKSELAEQAGVSVFHITDWEWQSKSEIIKSMLKSKLGCSEKIYARETSAVIISTAEARSFFDTNHLQGFIAAKYYVGLKLNDEIIMAVSIGKPRYKNDTMELYRMASKLNTTVVGGGSKLLAFVKNLINKPIISYCDRSKSSGRGYVAMGFTLLRKSPPGYFWTDGNEPISRYKCSKQKLKSWLKSYDETLSESENMFRANYRRYWDCGNYVFIQ